MGVRAGTKAGAYRAKRSRTSFGPRGDEALRLMYQLGGLTVDQYQRFFGTSRQNVYRVLSGLASQGLTEQWPIATAGRPKDFHHLSKKDAGRAIVAGGIRAGVNRERDARSQWKLHQIPATAEHAYERNEFYLALMAAAGKDGAAGVEVPMWEMWGESYPEFPLQGEGRKRAGERSNARMVYEQIYPDGIFTISWPELEQRYVVELETRSRSQKVFTKLDAYAGRWLQLQEEDESPLGFEGFYPVLFLLPTRRRAEQMRDRIREEISGGGAALDRYRQLRAQLKERGVSAGWFVLFASSEEKEGGLGKTFLPLVRYDKTDSSVNLEMVARAYRKLRS